MRPSTQRAIFGALAFSFVLVAVPTSAQGPIECTKEDAQTQTMKADFWWRGCLKLKSLQDEVTKTLKDAERAELAESVFLAARMMGCPL